MRTDAPVQWKYLPILPSNSSRGFERRVYGSNTAEFVNSKYHQKFSFFLALFYAKSPISQKLPALPVCPSPRRTRPRYFPYMAMSHLTLAATG